MSKVSDMDVISAILGEVRLIKHRLDESSLSDRMNVVQEFLQGVSKEGVFDRESLYEMRASLKRLRSSIDEVIPMKIVYSKEDDNDN